jgi:hypothetical protein
VARKVRLRRQGVAEASESSKDRLINGLVAARQNLIDRVVELSPHQQEQVFLGEWSVTDLMAHLIGWDNTYVAAVQDLIAGDLPGFYAAYDEDWRSYNRQLVREYGRRDWIELMAAVSQSHSQLVGYLKTIPEEEFGRDFGVRYRWAPVTIARLLEAEIQDEREHLRQIKQWAGP